MTPIAASRDVVDTLLDSHLVHRRRIPIVEQVGPVRPSDSLCSPYRPTYELHGLVVAGDEHVHSRTRQSWGRRSPLFQTPHRQAEEEAVDEAVRLGDDESDGK